MLAEGPAGPGASLADAAAGADSFAALRAEAAEAIRADGLSDARAAREVGVGGSTLNAWRNGKYSGDDEAVAAKVRGWLQSRRARAATRAVVPAGPGFVPTPTARAVMGMLDRAQHTPDLVLVAGGAGIGKSTAARQYRATRSNVWIVTAHAAFADAGPRMFLDEIADVLGEPERRNSQRLMGALVRRLRDAGALLVVDEAQFLPTRTLEQVRTLHDLAGVGVALLGNETVHARLEGSRHDASHAQLYSRVGMRLTRPAPVEGDLDAVLDAWEPALGEDVRAALRDVAAEPGALRAADKVLRQAFLMLSADDGAQVLTERHVRLARRKYAPTRPAASASAVVSAARRELSQAAASADA